MTTRETTGLLSRSHADEAVIQTVSDKAHVALYGAIGWPWLLKSLRGGGKAEKRRLLERLQLPADALPNLGSWKADTRLLHLIVDEIERMRPRTVVELGCGATSLVIARALQLHGGGTLHSYDQHADFLDLTQGWLADYGLSAEMRHAALEEAPGDWPGYWYDLSEVPLRIDLLVIDGPPWTIHPYVRGAAESLFPRLSSGAMVLLDDASRPGERVVAGRWKRRWPQIAFSFDRRGTKGTLVGRKA